MKYEIKNNDGEVIYTSRSYYKGDIKESLLFRTIFEEALEQGVSVRNCDLRGINLDGADLSGVDLSYSNLTSASLHEANLEGANLTAAFLLGANLKGARLDGAIFEDAVLDYVKFRGFDFLHVSLTSAQMTRVYAG